MNHKVVNMLRSVAVVNLLSILAFNWVVTEPLPQQHGRSNVIPTPDLIESHGYTCETHYTTTADGYILTIHRIPYGREGPSSERKIPVFVMHGLMAASNTFVALGSEYGIAYNLADAGFDVWMGNARGNRDSRKHRILDPDDSEEKFQFWDFTYEEIALYDVPKMIDYVLESTGFEKLHYIGHSQGGTVFFILNSMRPEYNEKFATAHLMAPIGYKQHFPSSFLSTVAIFIDNIYDWAIRNGIVEFGQNLFASNKDNIEENNIWSLLIREIRGDSNTNNDVATKDFFPDENMFGGASMKQLAHVGQSIRSTLFQRWDFGLIGNQQHYGSIRPPRYDLTLVTASTTLHYTVGDNLQGEEDVLEMERVLPNAISRKVAKETFEHTGFIFDKEVKELVTDYIIEQLQSTTIRKC